MRRIGFIPGGGKGAHAEDELLVSDLRTRLGDRFRVDFPSVEDEGDPAFSNWAAAIAGAVEHSPAALVGHSLGGYFLLKWLAEHPAPTVELVCVLAAPFPSADEAWTFDGFELHDDLAARLSARVILFAGQDDDVVPFAHRAHYAQLLPHASVRTTTGGHQFGGDLSVVAADLRALP